MATNARLSEGWTLTDGVMKPFLLAQPTDVLSALRDQGLVEADPTGTRLTHQEWVKLRTFTYALRFWPPEEEDELVQLYFERLAGRGWAYLNGKICWRFEDSDAHIPINSHLIDGENLLELRFEPAPDGARIGMMGHAYLRTSNYIVLTSARFWGRGDGIRSDVRLEALTSGKYVFKYTVSLDDQAVLNLEFVERLRAASGAQVAHELKLSDPVYWDPFNPDGTRYNVRLSIERMGVGCELIRTDVALLPDAYKPARIARLSPVLLQRGEACERNLNALFELGVQAVHYDDHEEDDRRPMFSPNYLPFGLLSLCAESTKRLPVERALPPLDKLRHLAGDMDFWPTDEPLYRLLQCDPLDVPTLEALFGVNAAGDAGRCIRLTRTLQAERLYVRAMEARLQGEAVLLDDPIEPDLLPISRALIESGGSERPSYQALAHAWAPLSAYVRLPESLSAVCGQPLELMVYLLNDGAQRQLSVRACCIGPDGAALASVAFGAGQQGAHPLGPLSLMLPEEPAALTIRAEVSDGRGALLQRHDALLCAHREDAPPLGALMNA